MEASMAGGEMRPCMAAVMANPQRKNPKKAIEPYIQ
jgi:hypothetical protein